MRKAIIPAYLAFGQEGLAPYIPPGSVTCSPWRTNTLLLLMTILTIFVIGCNNNSYLSMVVTLNIYVSNRGSCDVRADAFKENITGNNA